MNNFELGDIFIPIKDRKQARFAKKLLIELGQPIREDFFTNTTPSCEKVTMDLRKGGWILGLTDKKQKITFRDLIQKLSCPPNTHFYDEEAVEVEKPKAIKCENELEYEAMNKYLKSNNMPFNARSYKSWGGVKPLYYDFDRQSFTLFANPIPQLLPFSQFAKDNGIKVPLLKSEDGVMLYNMNKLYRTVLSNGVWEMDGFHNLYIESPFITNTDKYKAFSTKQAAEKWIEEQKPKEVRVKLAGYENYAVIDGGDCIVLKKASNIIHTIDKADIELISQAIKHLKG